MLEDTASLQEESLGFVFMYVSLWMWLLGISPMCCKHGHIWVANQVDVTFTVLFLMQFRVFKQPNENLRGVDLWRSRWYCGTVLCSETVL